MNAKRAFEDSRYAQAQDLFGQVLNEDPNNATAILYEGLSIGWQGNTVRYTLEKARDAAIRALDVAFSYNGGDDNFEVFALESFSGMDALGTALISLSVKYQVEALQSYKNTIDSIEYRRRRMDVVYGDFEGLKRELNQAESRKDEVVREQERILKRTLDLMLDVFRKSISFCKNSYYFRDITLKTMNDALDVIINMGCWNSGSISDIKGVQSNILEISRMKKEVEVRKYWDEHKDEKNAYEAEIQQKQQERSTLSTQAEGLKTELKQVTTERDARISEEDQLQNVHDQVVDLKIKRSKLGIFKVKEKKEIDAQIAGLEENEKRCETLVQQKRKERNDEYEPRIQPLKQRVEEVEKEIASIDSKIGQIQRILKSGVVDISTADDSDEIVIDLSTPSIRVGAVKIEAGAAAKVFEICKKVGDAVQKGDTVVIIEAMKMELPMVAPKDGVIASINVAVGDQIEAGEVLATMD